MLTNKTVQENTDKQTQYRSEKVNNLKYSRTKLPWFSCLLQHSARNAPEPTRGCMTDRQSDAATEAHTEKVFRCRADVCDCFGQLHTHTRYMNCGTVLRLFQSIYDLSPLTKRRLIHSRRNTRTIVVPPTDRSRAHSSLTTR